MRPVEHRRYSFERASHWRSGVSDLLEVSDRGLEAPRKLSVSRLADTGRADRTAALAYDPCGDLHWLREGTFDLVRLVGDETLVLGRLPRAPHETSRPVAMVFGFRRLWLQVAEPDGRGRIARYATDGLQKLGTFAPDRSGLALCSDGRDGAWVALGGDDENACLVHLDASGAPCEERRLPTPLRAACIDASSDGSEIFVLDPCPVNEKAAFWRLWAVPAECSGGTRELQVRLVFFVARLDAVCWPQVPGFHPDLMAVDGAGRVHLLEAGGGQLWTLSSRGEVLARRVAGVPPPWLPVRGLAARGDVVLSGERGIARLEQSQTLEPAQPDAVPTFITPVLVSPDGMQRGWMRADLDVEMATGAAIEVDVATTRDEALVEQARSRLANAAQPALSRLRALDELLPWDADRTRVFRGDDASPRRCLRVPLHTHEDTHLWLRVRIHVAAESRAPRLCALRVLYPNLSYDRYLPAVYREDEAAAKFLRQLMTVLESVFGDLEGNLVDLPRRLDPRTAPDDWLPFLLSWLGLPPASELEPTSQRALLEAAPRLLELRGTRAGLELLLAVLVGTGGDAGFSITDRGEGPGPWRLPTRARPQRGSRLGVDTLSLVQPQPGFRLGREAELGAQPLGYGSLVVAPLYARRSRFLGLRVAVSDERRTDVEALLGRYLPHFVPAHCRYRMQFVSPRGLRRLPVLDSGTLLRPTTPHRAGDDLRLGRSPLGVRAKGALHASWALDGGLTLS